MSVRFAVRPRSGFRLGERLLTMDFETGIQGGFIEEMKGPSVDEQGIRCPVYFSRQVIARHVTFGAVKRGMSQGERDRFDEFREGVVLGESSGGDRRARALRDRRLRDIAASRIIGSWKHSVSATSEQNRSVHVFRFMTFEKQGLVEAELMCLAMAPVDPESPVLIFMLEDEAGDVVDKLNGYA